VLLLLSSPCLHASLLVCITIIVAEDVLQMPMMLCLCY
jgi:hypothetical protein